MTQNRKETLNLRKAKTSVTLNEISENAKTPLMLKVEERLGIDIRRFLRYHYIEKGFTWEKIAEIAEISPKTIWEWGKRFGIGSRNAPNTEPNTPKERFHSTNGCEHITCCLCLSCQRTSSKCSYTKTHKRGYCIAYCPSYKWKQLR